MLLSKQVEHIHFECMQTALFIVDMRMSFLIGFFSFQASYGQLQPMQIFCVGYNSVYTEKHFKENPYCFKICTNVKEIYQASIFHLYVRNECY